MVSVPHHGHGPGTAIFRDWKTEQARRCPYCQTCTASHWAGGVSNCMVVAPGVVSEADAPTYAGPIVPMPDRSARPGS